MEKLPAGMGDDLAAFAGELRRVGIRTHVRAVVDAGRSLMLLDLSDREVFKTALRANFIDDRSLFGLFDRVFEEYWQKKGLKKDGDEEPEKEEPLPSNVPGEEGQEGAARSAAPPSSKGATSREVLTKKDLRYLTPEEEPELEKLMTELLRRLKSRPGRRYRIGHRGRLVDFRASYRKSMKSGGELIKLLKRERKPGKTVLAFLGDVSGSMDLYSRFFFQLAYGFSGSAANTKIYAFSTRLFDLNAFVRARAGSLSKALDDTRGWSGGTRIGECLKAFTDELHRSPHLSRTKVIILSDGWDRGDPKLMRREMARLKSAVDSVYWLNPLKSEPGYKPLARGMAAALPYLDGFYPANNVESFLKFARKL